MNQSNPPKTILIAEDDHIIRGIYIEELTKGGFNVQSAEDGEEALKKMAEHKPDLVLLDIMMPKKSGLDVLAAMKTNPQFQDIPVFVLSALGDPDDKARGLSLGAVKYIAKAETIPGKVTNEIKTFFEEKNQNI